MSDLRETEFGVVSLTTDELLSMDANERNFLLAASLITNDIRFHWSLMVRCPIDGGGTDLGAMQIVRWLWVTRKLAGVIYEAIRTLSSFCNRIEIVKNLRDSDFPELDEISCKANGSYKTAGRFRNFSAFHYSENQLGSELKAFAKDDAHRIFAHRQQGNSISELAEQIFTLPTVLKHNKSEGKEFDDWCKIYSGAVVRLCDRATARIVLNAFPNKSYSMQTVSVKDEAADLSVRWPLFSVIEDKEIQP